MNPADPKPNTTFIYLETGFTAILTSYRQKILTLKTLSACLYSKAFYFQPDQLHFGNWRPPIPPHLALPRAVPSIE